MPKRVPEEAKRVPLNCLISPATKRLLRDAAKELEISQGEALDRAMAAWVKFRDDNGIAPRTLTETTAAPIDAIKDHNRRRPKAQPWKRGPRPKGDKSR